jgi:hypothetical protein
MAASRGVRALWATVGSVFTVVTIGWGTAQAVAALAHEEHDVRTVFHEPVRVVEIDAAGSVTVIGGDRVSATVAEHVSRGLHGPDRSMRLVDGRLTARGVCGHLLATFCRDDFVLRVPRSVRLDIEAESIHLRRTTGDAVLTTAGGAIELDGVRGALRLSSHGGEINARDLGARRADATSYGGNISLEFAVPPLHVDASSHGGHVVIALPDGPAAYRVETSTAGGSTESLVRTDPESDRVVRAESVGGDVTIRYVTE